MSDLSATLAASALAGALGRLPCHPIDTLKARQQAAERLPGAPPARMLAVARQTAAKEGFRGFYRGVGVAVVGSTPATCLYLTSYNLCKDALAPVFGEWRFLGDFTSGFVAEAVSCCLWVPIDVVKERLQVQTPEVKGRYTGSLDGLRTVSRMEGLRGLYKGYFSTLGSFGPYSAFYFLFYEQLKAAALQHIGGGQKELPFGWGLTCGAAASGLAAAITNPLDMVKLRLQVQRTRSAAGEESGQFSYRYRGMVHGLRAVVQEEGVAGLWKGVAARVLFAGPNAAITMALFEQIRSALTA
eukprot:Hpha_TRINITY_DN28282_c0_g1::TRINITY_DN28282_c0_g1_i1::g.116781::m.116781